MIHRMKPEIQKYLAEMGRRGGLKSRRHLPSATAKEMVRIREARRAYRKFYDRCFWSFDPNYTIRSNDIQWVAEELMKNGGRSGYLVGAKLCR